MRKRKDLLSASAAHAFPKMFPLNLRRVVMKKFISGMLCLLLITAMALGVSAAGSAQMSLKSSAGTAYRGDTFTLTVSLKNDQPVTGGGVSLSYDSAAFTVTGGSSAVSGGSANANGGSFALDTETVVSGTIFTFQVKVKEDAPFGSYSISGSASLSVSCGFSGTTVTVACNHDYQNCTEVDEDMHESTCTVCGEKLPEEHTWDKGEVTKRPTCQETGRRIVTCTGCGATETRTVSMIAHDCTYENLQAEGHRYTCKKCGETGIEMHSYSDVWEHDANVHYRACAECGYQRDQADHVPGPAATETTNQVCTVCDRVLKVSMNHDHTFVEEWVSDETAHWYQCADCDATRDMAEHEYDDDCDPDCNVCAATRQPPHSYGDWTSDNTNHWKVCSSCGEKAESAAHTPSEEALPQCTVCGKKLPTDHKHEFEGAHTHTCACGETQSGTAQFCKVCGTFPWWVLCVAEAVLFAGVLLYVIQKRKSSDELEEEYDEDEEQETAETPEP